MTSLIIRAQIAFNSFVERSEQDEAGQGTAEYALVLMLAAAVAFVVTKYISNSGKSNSSNFLGKLVSGIVGGLTSNIGGLLKLAI